MNAQIEFSEPLQSGIRETESDTLNGVDYEVWEWGPCLESKSEQDQEQEQEKETTEKTRRERRKRQLDFDYSRKYQRYPKKEGYGGPCVHCGLTYKYSNK